MEGSDIMSEFGGFGSLTKAAILNDRDEPSKTPKKVSRKKESKSDNDSEPVTGSVQFEKLPNARLPASAVKAYAKATATQKEEADYDVKKALNDKISEYLQSFPYIQDTVYGKWPKYEKKPFSYTKDQLKEIVDDCVKEINRPATVNLTRSVLVAGMKGFAKLNEYLNTGKDYRDADIELASELSKKEWDVLLQQIAIKWGFTNIPVEVLFLKKTWDVLDDVDRRNKAARAVILTASNTQPNAATTSRYRKAF